MVDRKISESRSRSVTEADRQVGRNVRKHRLERGLTLTELAGMMEVSPQQLQKYETGKDRLTAGKVYDVVTVLKLPIKLLFDDVASSAAKNDNKTEELRNVCRMWIERTQSLNTLQKMARVLKAML